MPIPGIIASSLPPAINLLIAPTDLSNAAWVKTRVTIITDAATGPDGAMTADKMSATSAGDHYAEQVVTKAASDLNYILKAYVKAVEIGEAQLGIYSDANDTYQDFDLLTGTTISGMGHHGTITQLTAEINPVANGYYELIVRMIIPSTITSFNPFVQLVATGQTYSFTNNGAGYYVGGLILNTF